MTDTGCTLVGFGGDYVAIEWSGAKALSLIDFLCCDLETTETEPARTLLKLSVEDGEQPHYLLREGRREIYGGGDYYELAYALINEIIYQVIVDNNSGLAIHSGALSINGRGVLLPGQSGSGKSTFSAWLLSRGWNYLTDELVFLDLVEKTIDPLTRPLSLKSGSIPIIKDMVPCPSDAVIEGPAGMMVPHRLFSSNFSRKRPPLALVLFPQYEENAQTRVTKMSGALGCARLLECYVNARNLEDHGIDRLAALVRTTPVYHLTYSSFDGVEEMLKKELPSIFL